METSQNCVVALKNATIYHTENPFVVLSERNLDQCGEAVLSDVNISIGKGEFVYLIGRVGSGKSSLLKTLYAELPLLEGDGEVSGFDLRTLRKKDIPFLRRKIGIVFQDMQLLSDRSVYDNLEFVMRATGWSETEEIECRIEEVLAEVGLVEKAAKLPFELSGGERQRLGIARALLNAPSLILADEPTGNLDPLTADSIVQLFKRIAASGTTVVMSTHNTSIIEAYPSRTLLFSQKRIREIDMAELLNAKSSI